MASGSARVLKGLFFAGFHRVFRRVYGTVSSGCIRFLEKSVRVYRSSSFCLKP